MARSISEIASRFDALKKRYADRDGRMLDVLAIRQGNLASIAGDLFPEGMDTPMVANFIDVAAHDIAELQAPLPSFNCMAAPDATDRQREFANRRTQIVNHYIDFAQVQTQMFEAADWYNSYGFIAATVEPDVEAGMPRIRFEEPIGLYPEFDRAGRVVSVSKSLTKSLIELVNEFPEYEPELVGPNGRDFADWNQMLEIVRYEDKDQVLLFLPSRNNLPLIQTENPIGRVSWSIKRKPSLNPDDPRGQFDDIVWVQVARARFAQLAMEAAEKSVQSPLVVPSDVGEVPYGADAIIRTSQPQSVRRVGLELPSAAFTEQSVLEQEMRLGARYPEGRSGNIDASIITGQGVQALLGGFDTQIKTAQTVFTQMFTELVALCFEMDEKLFNFEKTISGLHQGAPYKLTYAPSKDIKGDYTVQVRYGLMSGLDPSRALIFALQALQAGLISRQFVMSELPWPMNVSEVIKDIEIERMRDQLSGSFASMAQAIPQMAAQGQNPSQLVTQIASVIDMRKRGTPIEDAVAKVFAQPEPEPAQPDQMIPPAGMAAPVEPAPSPAAPESMTSAGGTPEGAAPAAPPQLSALLAQLGG